MKQKLSLNKDGVKSSVNENKEYALRVLPNRQLVHESGRGEVLLAKLVTSPAFPFLLW
jgi:hypothetical protein